MSASDCTNNDPDIVKQTGFLANVHYMLSPVRLSSVTFVRPTQAV